ncbi:Copia protein, partial [Trachymyrmex cornetzi]
SVEYTPQQNGVAERANRTIEEMARCMLLQSEGPTSLWAEAVNKTVFLRNRCPSKATGDKTPLELWSGKKPDVRKFRTFGSHVTALRKGPGNGTQRAKISCLSDIVQNRRLIDYGEEVQLK